MKYTRHYSYTNFGTFFFGPPGITTCSFCHST